MQSLGTEDKGYQLSVIRNLVKSAKKVALWGISAKNWEQICSKLDV